MKDKPWITLSIKTECRLKEKLYKDFIKSKTEYKREKYVTQKRKVNSLIRRAKTQYYEKYFQNDKTNNKMWKFIKSNKNNKQNTSEIRVENCVESNPKKISQAFNNYFSTIGSSLASKINGNNDYKKYLKESIKTKFHLKHTNSIEINQIILSLRTSNSVGLDEISIKIIKENSYYLSIPLSLLINRSISEGHYPSHFKTAKVIPVFKKGSKKELTNYRPIALLSNLSKIFEKLVYLRLTNYFNENDLLYKYQFGFRKHCSTTHSLMSINDLIVNTLEAKQKILGIFLDLSKAFDTVNIEILIEKLNYYGVFDKELLLLKSFLSNRKQITYYNNIPSNTNEVNIGVPQGSILGPLLFLIYINDLKYFLSETLLIYLFADDTTVFFRSNSIEEVYSIANNGLNKLNEWFKANKLTINYCKTEYIVFGKNHINDEKNVFIGSNLIKRVNTTKYLGLEINQNLKWNLTVKSIKDRVTKYKYPINCIKYYISKDKLITLYKSLILQNIAYGIEIYGNCTGYLSNQLQKIQNYFLKLILKREKRYSTVSLHKEAKILLIKDLYRLKTCLLLFDKLNKKNTSAYFQEISIIRRSSVHSHNTRFSDDIITRVFKGKRQTVDNVAKYEWNSLPTSIKEITCRKLFKKELTTYYFSKY